MKSLVRIFLTVAVLFFSALVVMGVALFMGVIDFSATATPSVLEEKLAHVILERSLERRAPSIANPLPSSPSVLQEGTSLYRVNCLVCHGAPGVEQSNISKGLNPAAPDLAAPGIQDDSDGELFWIVSNGIRMTGMPAFGPTHSEEEIWSIIAVIRHLPQLTEEERAFLAGGQAHVSR
jgi:mono/diheme cytochrome c family protein